MVRKVLLLLEDFFGISPKESRGALLLIVVSMFCLLLPLGVKHLILARFQDASVPFSIQSLDSAAALLPEPMAAKGKSYGVSQPNSNSPEKAIHLTFFDPNQASVEALMDLGIPRFLALRMDNYRKKGGKFKRPEDVQRIYDFPPALYSQLKPYISIPTSEIDLSTFGSSSEGEVRSEPKAEPAFVKKKGNLIPFDINQADTAQLSQLKGIGPTRAARIIKFRDALGGFHATSQYSELYGMDSLSLSELRRLARVVSPPRQIPINKASAAELARHPYLRNRKLCEVIVRYREQHGPFASPESMKAIHILDENTLRKIAPYLSF
ncbi:ComEA family DNA-binding protein [Arundinibacter roseus]|uniref:Helix-hairpin-helix domain-containing protein n=1 Tax=Arundinibacter roseus TaxID=2070510 RepID=A0A4R4KID5_9BACT|nr:helix-hairpin-helix domain-containing protein [Arundinibacter roseus]TDB67927.1 helix-hairpin-helix domain-containing protein [Arundinibacter roseus]